MIRRLTFVSWCVIGFLQVDSFAIRQQQYHHKILGAPRPIASFLPKLRLLLRRHWDRSLHVATANSRSTSSKSSSVVVEVNDLVGSGSYGCVHLCTLSSGGGDNKRINGIGKRSWTLEDLSKKKDSVDPGDTTKYRRFIQEDESSRSSSSGSSSSSSSSSSNIKMSLQDQVKRCQYYWRVEQHCFRKLPRHDQIPCYQGSFSDAMGQEWLVFDIITDCHGERPAPTLLDLMKQAMTEDATADTLSSSDQQNLRRHHHHLHVIEQALGLKQSVEMGDTLDIIFESLLQVLTFVHAQNIVHRDIKPGNILVTTKKLVLLDFGSAADLEPVSRGLLQTRIGMEDGNRVAISPVYAAPEVFIDIYQAPTAFDIFSGALLFCQLLFHYFDERTDAGFHQQLREADYNIDDWLRQELVSKVRPNGLEDALEYLGERPGLWRLLGDMMLRDPTDRPLSSQALDRFRQILGNKDNQDAELSDGPFFTSVIESMESCAISELQISRPLHFVASMRRSLPLGLVLSEAIGDDDSKDEFENPSDLIKWKRATADALPGQVFIMEIIPGGQAEELGIFEVGDQLQGVGELPLLNGGFERAVEMVRPKKKL